jgi:hypothetical protein
LGAGKVSRARARWGVGKFRNPEQAAIKNGADEKPAWIVNDKEQAEMLRGLFELI